MNIVNLEDMLKKLERLLDKPNPPPTLLKDYVLPCLQEVSALVGQCSTRLSEVEDLVDSVGDKADAAFITARETLSGELFEVVAVNIAVIRAELLRMGLVETDLALVASGNIESAVYTYTEHLAADGDDDEGGENEGGEGEEGGEDAVDDGSEERGPVDVTTNPLGEPAALVALESPPVPPEGSEPPA